MVEEGAFTGGWTATFLNRRLELAAVRNDQDTGITVAAAPRGS
jgi:23S rRNA C2498 (ribose-2'-O)-methylase RlmM